MITLADMIDAGIEFQGEEIRVKHYNFDKDEFDFNVKLDDVKNKHNGNNRISDYYNREVKYIYPLPGVKDVLVIEVADKD